MFFIATEVLYRLSRDLRPIMLLLSAFLVEQAGIEPASYVPITSFIEYEVTFDV